MGRKVGLNEGAWYHSRWERGHGTSQEDIRDTIEHPDRLIEDTQNGTINYLKFVPARKFFRLVGVREKPGREPSFQVATAFGRSTPPPGKVLWQKPLKP